MGAGFAQWRRPHQLQPYNFNLDVHSDALLRDADIYVNGLFANAPQHGAALLCANVSRSIMTLALAPEQVRTLWSVAHVMSVPRKLPFRQLSTRRATCDVEHVHLP